VVGRERAAQVHAEQALLHHDERDGLGVRHDQGDHGEVPGEVHQQQRAFQGAAAGPGGAG
jgi:hypothetical protein